MPKVTLEEVNALNPWFAPVNISGIAITTGVGSTWSHTDLAARHAYREALLVTAVAKRYNLKNKAVLDLGCNCGYWSAKYVQQGAINVVGVEGRENTVKQAELYWKANEFLPAQNYRFLLGDVTKESIWRDINLLGPFDLTLCAGLLYHIPNYKWVLQKIKMCTRDIVVIDTRVVHTSETAVAEKKDLHFNGVDVVTPKIVPNLENLTKAILATGFHPQVVPAPGPVPHGLAGPDDYVKKNRVTIIAKRA